MRRRRCLAPAAGSALLLLAALLLATAGLADGRPRGGSSVGAAEARRRLGEAEEQTRAAGQDVPAEFTITNATLLQTLKRAATPEENAIIFTTFRLPGGNGGAELAMIANFCRWLDHAGVLGHTLLLTTDPASWRTVHAAGLPAWLDRVFPERQEYRDGAGSAPDTPNRVFDVMKHYWGATIISHGFRAMYMDSDAIVLANPLPRFNAEQYDVQSIADWPGPELPPVGATLLRGGCGLYGLIPDSRTPTASILREWWRYQPGDKERALSSPHPCASTGVWYLEPTPMAIRFMAALRDRLLAPETRHQWDQTAWNEVVMHFLWGSGEEAPLRYRLLPYASFYGGVGNYETRLEQGLPLNPVVLHSGGHHGGDKQAAYERLGLWHGDFRLPQRPPLGARGTQSAEARGGVGLPAEKASPAEAEGGEEEAGGQAAGRPMLGLLHGTAGGAATATVTAAAYVFAVLVAAACLLGLTTLGLRARTRAQQQRRPAVVHISSSPARLTPAGIEL